jgi:vitamin B12 transporter
MKRIFITACMACLAAGVKAQTGKDSSSLDEVVVTANRFPQKQQQTGKVVTVIPREVLEKNSGRNMGEILNQYAGLTVIGANNNPGTNVDVYTRGSGLGNTLILINGMPVYDVSSISSAFDLNFITPDMVERIEVLKGGQSTTYGSDAVSGVINIITRKASAGKAQPTASVAAGSFGTLRAGAGISGTLKDAGYNLRYQYLSTRGLSSALDTTGKAGFDRDGLRQHNILGSVNGKFSETLRWNLIGQANLYRTDLDANAFTDEKDHTATNRNYVAGAGLEYRLPHTVIHANYNVNHTDREYLDDSVYTGGFSKYSASRYRGMGHFAEVYANIRAGEKLSFLAGTDLRRQGTDQDFLSVSSFGPYETSLAADSARINVYSAYASAFYRSGKGFFLEAGGRWNSHSRYGNNLTYTLNPSYVMGRWKAFVNLSSAFKAPTLFQLYDAISGYLLLKPERSLSFEAGLQYMSTLPGWQARAVFFTRRLKDGIDYSLVDYRYFNNNRANDRGLELESRYRKGRWSLDGNYTYVTGRVNTVNYKYDPASFSFSPAGDTSYDYQFRRPAHSLNLSAGYQVTDRLQVNLHGRYASKRYEPRFMQPPVEVDPYVVIDLYAAYRIREKIRLFADVRNLLNSRYVDIPGFTTRPFHVMAGIDVQF